MKMAGIISVLATLFSHSAVAGVEELLLKVAEAYGGQTRITEVGAWLQSGVTISTMQGKEGRILRSYRHPDHLRIEIEYDNHETELRVIAGANAWKQNQPADKIFYSAMLLQAARLGLPAVLFEHKKQVRDAGIMTGKQGQELHALVLDFHGKYQLLAGIDPDSGRIMESRGIIAMEGARMEFGTTYDDFRFQDGRLFAFAEEHYAIGQKTGYTRIQSMQILPDLPDRLFTPSDPGNTGPDTRGLQKTGFRIN